MKTIDQAQLFFQEGNSDKVYDVRLEMDDTGYNVHFSYGRRGNSMTEGYKVQGVSEAVARKEFDKLILSKTRKGYQRCA